MERTFQVRREAVIRSLFLTASLLLSLFLNSKISASPAQEYTVKAALLLNFARFTEWPDDAFSNAQDPVLLCFTGNNIVSSSFAHVEGRPIGERKLGLRQLGREKKLSGCHLLFISGSNRQQLRLILPQIRNKPVLTVGEMSGFAESGGHINLRKKAGRVQIIVNIKTARHAGLTISSRLLKLATIVGQ
ncbi:MAG: YfiR family protein [Methylococcales bacterium]